MEKGLKFCVLNIAHFFPHFSMGTNNLQLYLQEDGKEFEKTISDYHHQWEISALKQRIIFLDF